MADVSILAGDIIQIFGVVQRLLMIHAPLPSNVDNGASARAGLKLRRIKRALTPLVTQVEEELEGERMEALRSRDPSEAFAASSKNILRTEHVVTIPELLTRADWDAIPMQAPHTMPNASPEGQPVVVTLRKTEADLDVLGPLVVDADELGGAG